MSDDENNAALIEWMARRGPDDWHRVALSYNWDNGLSPLEWIVTRPTCDRATALVVFWMTEPDARLGYASPSDAKADHAESEWRLVKLIADRWRAGAYARSEIALDPTDYMGWPLDEWRRLEAKHSRRTFTTSDDMHRATSGRTVLDGEDFQEGYPRELWPRIWDNAR